MGAFVGDGSLEDSPLVPLGIYRPFGAQPFTAADVARLSSLLPHLTSSLALRHRLRAAAHSGAVLALEFLSTAVVVLAANGTILFSNPAAEALLSNSATCLASAGRLCASGPAQLAALDRALAACSRYRFEGALSLAVRLAGRPGSGVVARLAPLPTAASWPAKAAAIAFLSREGQTALDLQAVMKLLYKLTPAEADLVKALTEDSSPLAIAERRCVSVATVKSQLQSVFLKTGTRRQSDLMRLAFSIAH